MQFIVLLITHVKIYVLPRQKHEGDTTVKSPFIIWLIVWEHMPQTGRCNKIKCKLSESGHTVKSFFSPDGYRTTLVQVEQAEVSWYL